MPQGQFLKGNLYFKQECKNPEGEEAGEINEDDTDEVEQPKKKGDQSMGGESDEEIGGEYERLANQQWRFFTDEVNPTLKCKNCEEYGHRQRDCPYETKKANCILCGKDTHDSFSCDAKTCFKCNKVGHVANQCTERNIVKCGMCGLNGHKDERCMKVWRPLASNERHLWDQLRCMQCGDLGHIKCMSERRSAKIPIDTKIQENLDEFVKLLTENDDTGEEISFDYIYKMKISTNDDNQKREHGSKIPKGHSYR